MRKTFVSVIVITLALVGFGNLTLAQKEKAKNQEENGHPLMVESDTPGLAGGV